MVPQKASPNSTPTSHQRTGEIEVWPLRAWTIKSIIRRETASNASGTKAAKIRKAMPEPTTRGPASQTIFRAGGILESALKRSRQADRNESLVSITGIEGSFSLAHQCIAIPGGTAAFRGQMLHLPSTA